MGTLMVFLTNFFFQQKEIILMGEKRSALSQNQLGKVVKVFSTQVSVIALIDAKT